VFVRSEVNYLMVPIFNSVGFILAGMIGLLFAMKNVSFKTPKLNNLKVLFKESSQLFVSNLSTTLYTTSNTLILGLFTNNSMVGVYASMEKLVIAVKNLYTPIFQAMFPWLSSKNPDKVITITSKLVLPLFFLGSIIFLIIFFFAEQILEIIYNDALITSYSNVFKILGLIAILSGLNMLFNMLFLSALKKYKERMKIILTAGIINLILALIFVKFYNIYGIAITVTFTELVLLLFGWYYYSTIKNGKNSNHTNSIS